MEAIVNLIVGTSTTLDVYVIVRLIVVMISLELFATACGFYTISKAFSSACFYVLSGHYRDS